LPEGSEPGIIGKSEAILYAIQKAKQVATTNAAVLLEGETGLERNFLQILFISIVIAVINLL
jgi:transcriptional regulator with GAF, ATPase, and Fis domain